MGHAKDLRLQGKELRELREIAAMCEEILDIIRRPRAKPATQILIHGGHMGLNITAGAAALLVQLIPLPSGSVFDSPADLELTADDPNVVIAPAPGDTTGTMFAVSTPASDTATSCNLDATGLAGGVQISGTALLTITPATAPPPPPNPATSIGIVAAPTTGTVAAAATVAKAATSVAAEGKTRAPAK